MPALSESLGVMSPLISVNHVTLPREGSSNRSRDRCEEWVIVASAASGMMNVSDSIPAEAGRLPPGHGDPA
ncbi:MAG TPA: hypothetical protein VIU14_10770 [Mesorhizobium sp.]